jgi:MFS family permease
MSVTTGPERETDEGARGRLLGLVAAIAAISVAGLGFGHSIPLFTVLLERAGASGLVNGLNTAAGALAVIVATPIYPRVIARLGLKRFLLLAVALMVSAYACIFLVGRNIALWYPLRFVFSMGASGMFVGSEVWINGAAPPGKRGQLIGIYSTCLALGFALGPLLLERTGYDGAAPFLVGIIVFASASLPVLLAKAPPVEAEPKDGEVLPVVASAPVTFGASSVFGATETAMLVFLPLLALAAGYGEAVAARVVAAYGFGLLAMQYAIGQAADRFGIMRTLIACASGAALAAAVLPLTDGAVWPLYACVFVLGGLVAGVSTSGLVLLGDRFQGPRLAAASTGYAFAWGLGAIVGPSAAGLIRDTLGFDAIFYAVSGALAAYALAAWARRGAAFP